MAEEWLTTEQAAELSGYHPVYLRGLLREGKIKGRKWGPAWQVNRKSLLAYIEAAEVSDDRRRGPKD
jgi:excisionase family DNA binding protein